MGVDKITSLTDELVVLNTEVVLSSSYSMPDVTALETQVTNKEYEGWIWFNAVKLTSNVAAGVVVYDSVRACAFCSSHFDITTGFYTAPLDGTYQFTFYARTSDASLQETEIEMRTEHSGLINYAYDADLIYDKTVSMTSIVELTAGEEVWVNTLVGVLSSRIEFSGELIECNNCAP